MSKDKIESAQALKLSEKDSEEKFRNLYDQIPVCVLLHEPSTGKIIDANKTALETFKAESLEELQNANLKIGSPYGKEESLRWFKKALTEGSQEYEWLERCLDGSLLWEQVRLAPILIGDKLYILNTTLDISQRKRMERANLEFTRHLEFVNRKQRTMMDISNLFAKADFINFEDIINESLAYIGETFFADSAFIFMYDTAEHTISKGYDWCSEDSTAGIGGSEDIPLEVMDSWVRLLFNGSSLLIPAVLELDTQSVVRKYLEPKGIRSVLAVPLAIENIFNGFLGIDTSNIDEGYTVDDENFLKEYANALSGMIHRVITSKMLAESEERFRTTLFSIGDGVIGTNRRGIITMMNPMAEAMTGFSNEEAEGLEFEAVFKTYEEGTGEKCPNLVSIVLETCNIAEREDSMFLEGKDGSRIEVEGGAAPIIDSEGQVSGVVVVFKNCTEKKEKQREIEYLSMHDMLTGLYNRRYMEKILTEMDEPESYPLTIMYADVNGLKLTNDAFGHNMGDRLLSAVGDILRRSLRPQDVVGRIGGDEFIIVLPRTDDEAATEIKSRIQSMAEKEKLGNVAVSIAIGYEIKRDTARMMEDVRTAAENRMYKNKLSQGKTMRSRTIESVLGNINSQYDNAKIHMEKVAGYVEKLAKAFGANEKDVANFRKAGSLHDIGKIGVPPELLNQPKKLTQSEREIVKRHADTGYQILKAVDKYAPFAEIVLHHHEHWDGRGYPQGLKGEEIPLGSRMIAIADAFEVMTGNPPEAPRCTKEEALEEIKRCAGTQFDPVLAALFIEIFS